MQPQGVSGCNIISVGDESERLAGGSAAPVCDKVVNVCSIIHRRLHADTAEKASGRKRATCLKDWFAQVGLTMLQQSDMDVSAMDLAGDDSDIAGHDIAGETIVVTPGDDFAGEEVCEDEVVADTPDAGGVEQDPLFLAVLAESRADVFAPSE